ncbi:hypothetical protein Trydic_g1432 [Trypoxylus dichotomus]
MVASANILMPLYLIVAIVNVISSESVIVEPKQNVSGVGVCEISIPIDNILPTKLNQSVLGHAIILGISAVKLCCSGYNAAPNEPFHCVPSCPNGCGLGNCTAPNVCSCNKGADFGPRGRCVTVCPNGCLNGQCYGLSCGCNDGFTLEPNGKYCIPKCTRNCGPGGRCVANNQCKCQAGYQLNQQGICQIICGSGYRAEGNVCLPQCSGGCLNGKCIAPNRCRCNSGYNLVRNNICTPKCASPCHNGFCSAPNICTCKRGYVKDTTKTNKCIPYCVHGCLNATCSAPNFCTCKQGYVKDITSPKRNRCIPHCANGCPNGICSAPNFCICKQGYWKKAPRIVTIVNIVSGRSVESKQNVSTVGICKIEIPINSILQPEQPENGVSKFMYTIYIYQPGRIDPNRRSRVIFFLIYGRANVLVFTDFSTY